MYSRVNNKFKLIKVSDNYSHVLHLIISEKTTEETTQTTTTTAKPSTTTTLKTTSKFLKLINIPHPLLN